MTYIWNLHSSCMEPILRDERYTYYVVKLYTYVCYRYIYTYYRLYLSTLACIRAIIRYLTLYICICTIYILMSALTNYWTFVITPAPSIPCVQCAEEIQRYVRTYKEG